MVAEPEKQMCGIVGAMDYGPAVVPMPDALRRLEYRGYHTAGIARLERGLLERRRAVGSHEAERMRRYPWSVGADDEASRFIGPLRHLKLVEHYESSPRKNSDMNARNSGPRSSASRTHACRKTRTFIATVLLRFSNAYADLAFWVAPWLDEDGAER
jgi:hypothetical protein